MTSDRYAIYFAPDPASALWQRASRWLGRDAATGEVLPRPADVAPAPLQADSLVAAPAAYGFHATLKAPFRLAAEQTRDGLLAFAARFAKTRAPVSLPGLRVAALGDFIALVPGGNERAIGELANACVTEFDRFRAPLDEIELARRGAAASTARQAALIAEWGYPYVMEEFRFHMTLTGSLAASDRDAMRNALEDHFADIIANPLAVDTIAVFQQAGGASCFRILERFPLTRRQEDA